MDRSGLEKLSAAVDFLLAQEGFAAKGERVRAELRQTTSMFVWDTIEMASIPLALPANIKSCWIFHLRKNVPSGRHYHPNSIQHMAVVSGHAMADIGGELKTIVPFDAQRPVSE